MTPEAQYRRWSEDVALEYMSRTGRATPAPGTPNAAALSKALFNASLGHYVLPHPGTVCRQLIRTGVLPA